MEQKKEDFAILFAQAGPLNGQRWAIRNTLLVGREADCDIVVPDRQVSRHHARICQTHEGVYLEDLGSKNGTHHNGEQIKMRTFLSDGDIIQVALAQKFVYISSDATVPLEAGELENWLSQGEVESAKAVDQLPWPSKLYIEKESRRVWIGDEELLPPLSAAQFRLLEVLYENEGKVISRHEIVKTVWGEGQAIAVSEQALDALIRRLRDRLSDIDPHHAYLLTVRGHGLRLDNPPR